MKLFRKKEEQKKKAETRQLLKLQKSLEKAAQEGLAELDEEMKSLIAEFDDLLRETIEILPQMDQEIAECKARGEDTSEMEKTREELLQGIEEMKEALAGVPAITT